MSKLNSLKKQFLWVGPCQISNISHLNGYTQMECTRSQNDKNAGKLENLVLADQWSVPQKFVSGLGSIICSELADSLVSWLLFESWSIESGWLTWKSATTYRYGFEKFIRHESLIQMDITTWQSYKESWWLQAWAWRSHLEILFSVNCDNLEFFT